MARVGIAQAAAEEAAGSWRTFSRQMCATQLSQRETSATWKMSTTITAPASEGIQHLCIKGAFPIAVGIAFSRENKARFFFHHAGNLIFDLQRSPFRSRAGGTSFQGVQGHHGRQCGGGGSGPELHRQCGRSIWADRPERLRQKHHHEGHVGPAQTHARRGPDLWPQQR